MNDPLFIAIFDQLPEPYLIVNSCPSDHKIVFANRAFKSSVPEIRRFISGKSLWDVFDVSAAGKETVEMLKGCIEKAISSGRVQKVPPFRFAISKKRSTKAISRWWQIKISPVKGANGSVEYLICETKNMVAQADNDVPIKAPGQQNSALLLKHDKFNSDWSETLNEPGQAKQAKASGRAKELTDDEYHLRCVFETTPIALTIFKGEDLVIVHANPPVLRIWGRSSEEVIGKKLLDVFPELHGQPFPDILRSVLRTGQTIAKPEIPAMVVTPDGKENNIYVNFSCDPLYNINGEVDAILVTADEITELVQARLELQSRQKALEAMNKEIASVNKELTKANQELYEAQQELLKLYKNFVESKHTSDRLQQEFRLAVSTADLGSWSIDMHTQKLTMSERLREIFGLPLDGDVTLDMAALAIDAEYKDIVVAELNAGLVHHKDMDFEYPISNLITGKRIWVRATGKMFMDEHQEPKHFSGVFMDITERKQDEIRKNDFIGIVSHELKTPLTSVKGYLQLVNRQAAKENATFYESMSKKAIGSVGKMETLVKGFLNVARFGSGKIYLDMQVFSLNDLLESTIEDQRILSATHVIEYFPCDTICLFADRDKIGQVISNFLSNAAKYSPEESTITVRCEQIGNRARVSVHDEGIGVKKADTEKVFQRFFRVDEPANRHITGFGIGLYLCSEIIMRHQGKIWVESVPDAGSTFYFDIPINSETGQ